MTHLELKRKTLKEAIKKHQHVIDDFRAGISALLNSEPVARGQAKTAESIIANANPLGDQLEFATQEMKLLQDMLHYQDSLHDRVKLGSIVITDKDTFFVSTSIERFEVDGKAIFGLSTKTPLYKAMEGKKKGDSFVCKGTKYTIKEIL